MSIEPDTKDWTWVLERPCAECGFDAMKLRRDWMASDVRRYAADWQLVLIRPDVRRRPMPETWSALEYGCHVRDVFRVFGARTEMMLTEHDPTFPNWDQDETAIKDRYPIQDPVDVARELLEAAQVLAHRLSGVTGAQWSRTGRRSNGSQFTVDTLTRYMLHDVEHHLWDVGRP
ncbi:DinB family protein [Spongisporangium articulatum]|uniref:DinB family protein n=1 Tax=Spongisporangium articulatum TaxID=3362603 RepID=A0ABW8AGZ2_9ACTN